jgi:hypothetical protein
LLEGGACGASWKLLPATRLLACPLACHAAEHCLRCLQVACQDGSIALDLGRQEALAEYASEQNIACLAPWNEDEHEACMAAQVAQQVEAGKQQQQV